MKITKPLNNNAVMAYDKQRGEIIVLGPGIGFYAKKGDIIDEKKIQKIFTASKNERLIKFVESIDSKYLVLVEEICSYAERTYNYRLKEEVFVALTDHLQFAIKRIHAGIPIDNPFLAELKKFYPKEYEISQYAKKMIAEELSIQIPDEEAGYIAMHIVANDFCAEKKSVVRILEISDQSLQYIKEHYNVTDDKESIEYTRLVNHVKFFAVRYYENNEEKKVDDKLNIVLKATFQNEINCIEGLSKMLEKKYGRPIKESERNYLALHLRNCKL